jgi:hypothetical protein
MLAKLRSLIFASNSLFADIRFAAHDTCARLIAGNISLSP